MNFLKRFREYLTEADKQKGTYAGVRFSDNTIDSLIMLQERLGLINPVPYNKFHSTVLYSRKHLPNYVALGKIEPAWKSKPNFTLEVWESKDSGRQCLVLRYDCPVLEQRHHTLMNVHGATFDFPNYQPHVTLSYDVGSWRPDDTDKRIQFNDKTPIEIVEEYQEELNLDWAETALKEHVTQGINTVVW